MIPPGITAAGTITAVALVGADAQAPVAACGATATAAVMVVAAEAIRRGRALVSTRRRAAEREAQLTQRLAQQAAEASRLADVLLPEAVERLQRGDAAEEVLMHLGDETADREVMATHAKVLRTVVEAVQAEEELRDSAERAFVNIARRVQAIVHQQAQDLREMEDRHGQDADVFGDLLHLDHGTALIGRLADSIAVLGGARPGRQWHQDVPLFSVLRGAMSRIIDYQRVDLHSVADVSIAGPGVEPLIHALAELLDNATRYSPPRTRVHLTATEVQAGVAVEIEDGGIGLTGEARARAERVLSDASTGLDLTDLGETPRLGLSVVGRLAQANGFQVSLRPSAYGGVRAVLVVPQDLIRAVHVSGRTPEPAKPGAPAPKPAVALSAPPWRPPASSPVPVLTPPPPPAPAPAPTPPQAPARDESTVIERNADGLPQRRRKTQAAAARPRPPVGLPGVPGGAVPTGGVPSAAPTTSTVPTNTVPTVVGSSADGADIRTEEKVEPGLWLAAFHNAVNNQPTTAVPDRGVPDEASGRGEQR